MASYPKLVLEGDVATNRLTYIYLSYPDGSTSGPTFLTRSSYKVTRQTKNGAVSGGTANKYPDLPYDQFRYVHQWVGYADVRTSSVSYSELGDSQAQQNMALIKTSVVYTPSEGIPYTIGYTLDESFVGPADTALITAAESPVSWTHNQSGGQSAAWVITDITIQDNNNCTSRVTFSFQIVEPWQNFTSALGVGD